MLLSCLSIFTLVSSTALAYDPAFKYQSLLTKNLSRGIYGNDDRKEYFELNEQVQAATRSIPALVFNDVLKRQNDAYIIQPIKTGDKYHLCPGEPFYNQPSAAYCSGFIIGPDQIATAGHCVVENIQTKKAYPVNGGCENIALVFDFRLNYQGDKPLRFPVQNVYHCKKVISRKFNSQLNQDFAVIQLDRPIKGRPVLSIRNNGSIQVGDSVTSIGYPLGMPIKVVGGATVRSNHEPSFFTTDLDTFHGNSGGPVLDTASLISGRPRVEGILVRGPEDLKLNTDQLCYETKICGVQDAMNRKCWGEQVSRIENINTVTKMVHVRPVQQLLEIRSRNQNIQLNDELKLDINVPESGYLTVLEINPQGQYTVLFPNKHAPDNRVDAGPMTLTNSPDWKIQITSGPFGHHQLYAILSNLPDNLYQQNKVHESQFFAAASAQNLSSLSRGAQAVPRLKQICIANPEQVNLCSDKPKVASTRVCYYQESNHECR